MKVWGTVRTTVVVLSVACAAASCTKSTQQPQQARQPEPANATTGTSGIAASDSKPSLAEPVLTVGNINGQVTGAGTPIAGSTVTLWAAGSDAPRQLAQTNTGDDGHFALGPASGKGSSLYLIATGGKPMLTRAGGDNPAIALLTVVGREPPTHVVINEMTTVASVWTHAQFLDGAALKGHSLGLKIAAGNVPSFVDLQSGGWGSTIQDPLNSAQTPTMANFATLADVLAGCVAQVTANACSMLFAAA